MTVCGAIFSAEVGQPLSVSVSAHTRNCDHQ